MWASLGNPNGLVSTNARTKPTKFGMKPVAPTGQQGETDPMPAFVTREACVDSYVTALAERR